MKLVLPKIWN